MAYQKNAPRRYLLEIMTAAMLLLGAGWLRGYALLHTADPTLLLAAKLLPLFPIALIGVAIWRLYRNMDELQRQTILKISAVAVLMTVVIFMSWPSLRALGAPPLSPPGFILILAGCFFVCSAIISFLGFKTESGFKQAIVRMLPFAVMLASLAAMYFVLHVLWQPAPLVRSAIFMAGTLCIYGLYKALQRRIEP